MQQPQDKSKILRLNEVEHQVKKQNLCLLAAGAWGVPEYVGPITSVGVEVDYNNIIPELYEALIGNTITSSMENEIFSSMPVVYGHVLTVNSLIDIANTQIAHQLALYKAIYGAIWYIFGHKQLPTHIVTDALPLREVVRNTKLAEYTTNSKETPYIICSTAGSIKELVPEAIILTGSDEYLAIRIANLLSKLLYLKEMRPIAEKYANYDVLTSGISPKHKETLEKYGLTEHHRSYLPELKNYPYNMAALKAASCVTNTPKKYNNSFSVNKE